MRVGYVSPSRHRYTAMAAIEQVLAQREVVEGLSVAERAREGFALYREARRFERAHTHRDTERDTETDSPCRSLQLCAAAPERTADHAVSMAALLRSLSAAAGRAPAAAANRLALVRAVRAEAEADPTLAAPLAWDLVPWALDEAVASAMAATASATEAAARADGRAASVVGVVHDDDDDDGVGGPPVEAEVAVLLSLLAAVGPVRELFLVVAERLQAWRPQGDGPLAPAAVLSLCTLAAVVDRLPPQRPVRFLSSLVVALRAFTARAALAPRRAVRRRLLLLWAPLAAAIVRYVTAAAGVQATPDRHAPLVWSAWAELPPSDHARALAAVAVLDGLGALAGSLPVGAARLANTARWPHPPPLPTGAQPTGDSLIDTWADDPDILAALLRILVRRPTACVCVCERERERERNSRRADDTHACLAAMSAHAWSVRA
jgi:hypothetical protein